MRTFRGLAGHARPLRTAVLLLCATLLLGVAPGASQASAADPQAATTTAGAGWFRPWALQSETYGSNRAAVPRQQALADARNNDIITAHPIAYRGSIGTMRKVNPQLRVYAYLNVLYAQKERPDQAPQGLSGAGDSRPSCVTAGLAADCYWPAGWYTRDANGAYVRAQASGNYLMNPRVQGWRDSRLQLCKDNLAESGYNGCYLDMLGPASLSPSYVSSPPVDPQTGRTWDLGNYLTTTGELGGFIQKSMNPTPVIANGLSDGTHYFAVSRPTKALLGEVDGGVAEGWLRNSTRPANSFPTEVAWKASIDMIVDAERADPKTGKVGKPVLVIYKVWVPATQAQKDSHRTFAMASFLLGTGGRSLFFYSDDPKVSRTATYPGYHFAIGVPSGSYAKVNGVYRRPFTHGLVLVNPTSTAVTLDLGASYTTIDGQHRRYLTLAPDTGQILQGPATS